MQDKLAEQFIRQYLSSRNYKSALQAFETETETIKHKAKFNPSDIVRRVRDAIQESNLDSLHDIWSMLERTYFAHLSGEKQKSANSLKIHIYRSYLVNAKNMKRSKKLEEFFDVLSSEFQFGSNDWKPWCAFPHVSNPHTYPEYFMYYTKSWMDILSLSLTNFLSLIFYSEVAGRCSVLEKNMIHANQMNASMLSEKPQPPFGELIDDFNELGVIRTNLKH